MIVKASSAKEKVVDPMKIKEYDINSNFSGALVEINGAHGKMKNKKEDRVYFILEGNGTFVIDGKEEEVSQNDLVFISKNTPYDIKGKMKYFMLCSPEFDAKDDVMLK